MAASHSRGSARATLRPVTGPQHRLGTILQVELPQDSLDVGFNGAHANGQPARDLWVREPLREKCQHSCSRGLSRPEPRGDAALLGDSTGVTDTEESSSNANSIAAAPFRSTDWAGGMVRHLRRLVELVVPNPSAAASRISGGTPRRSLASVRGSARARRAEPPPASLRPAAVLRPPRAPLRRSPVAQPRRPRAPLRRSPVAQPR